MDRQAQLSRWDIYDDVVPPWETGRPQPALRAVAEAGDWQGRVLDIGCGTGEHALLAASLGLDATGIDAAATAIRIARGRAAERGLTARFIVADALDLGPLEETWDTVIDANFFQIFSDADRPRYVRSLSAVVRPGGVCHLLCFSDRQPGIDGPRRVSRAEIKSSFGRAWEPISIEEARIETATHADGAIGWLCRLRRR